MTRSSTVFSDQFYSPGGTTEPVFMRAVSPTEEDAEEGASNAADDEGEDLVEDEITDRDDDDRDVDERGSEEEDEAETSFEDAFLEEKAKLLELDLIDFPLKIFIDYEQQCLAILSDLLASFVPSYLTGDDHAPLQDAPVKHLFDLFMSLVDHAEPLATGVCESGGPPKKRRRSSMTHAVAEASDSQETIPVRTAPATSIESSPVDPARCSVLQAATVASSVPMFSSLLTQSETTSA